MSPTLSLIEAFQNGKVEGFETPPLRIVETNLSRLFFYQNKVCKAYKHQTDFFDEFNDSDFRKTFYEEDFSWNQQMSPSIYLALRAVRPVNGRWVQTEEAQAQDFFIEMKRVDEQENLFNLLVQGVVTQAQLKIVVQTLTHSLRQLTRSKIKTLRPVLKKGWPALMAYRLQSVRDFSYAADPHLKKSWTDSRVDALYFFFHAHPYFQSFPSSQLSAATDNHTENILLLDGEVGFIDVLLPREGWRVVDPAFNICRPAADVAVLAGRSLAEAMYREYQTQNPLPPSEIILFYEIYCAMVQAAYCHLAHKPQFSAKFVAFIDEQIRRLKV